MRVQLNDILREISMKTTINDQYPVLTSSKSGLYLQSDYFNKQVASKNNIGYKIIKRGQFTYRAMSDTGEFFPNMLECTDVGIVSPAYPVFEITNTDLILPEYLKYYFKSSVFQYSIASFVQGSTRTSVKYGKLKTISIELPTKEEQYMIVEILCCVEKIIAKRKTQLQQLDELVKSRFVELFGDCKNMVALNELCSVITDGTHQPPRFQNEGIPFIFVSNLANNTVTYNTEKFISEETYNELIKRTHIELGDILLSTVGSYGHPAVVVEERKFLFQRHIAYLKPKRSLVNSFYLHSALLAPEGQRQIEEKVKGIAQKTLNLSEIRKIMIPIPSIEEQNSFESFIKQVDKSKFCVINYLRKIQLIKGELL